MRRLFTHIAILVFAINTPLYTNAQSISVADRTPEQEATKQTEKMQKELNLTTEQAKSIYEINLKYARERQQSNKRSDAVHRIKKKNEEIGKVLNSRQNSELQTKRSEIQSVEIDGKRRYTNNSSRVKVIDNTRQTSAVNQRSDVRQETQSRPVRTTDSRRETQLNSSERANDRTIPQYNNRRVEQSSEHNRAERQNSSDYHTTTRPNRDSSSGSYERHTPVRSSDRRTGVAPSAGNKSSSQNSSRESTPNRR